MIIAVTAHFVVAPLGQRTSSHLPESMEHEGVNAPSCLRWEAAPLQVTHQHHLCLRWDVRENRACNRACKGFWEVKLTTEGLDKNRSRGLESLETCYQPGFFLKSWLYLKACSLSWSPKRQGQELSWKATIPSPHSGLPYIPHTHPTAIGKIWTPHSWLLQLLIKNKSTCIGGLIQPSQTYQHWAFLPALLQRLTPK